MSNRPRFGKWRLGILLLDAMLLAVIVAVQQWPLCKVRSVDVEGPELWKPRALGAVVLPPDSNLFRVDLDHLQARLAAAFGPAADCRVKITFPGTLSIRLIPTRPCLWTESGDGISSEGDLVCNPVVSRTCPVWRRSRGSQSADCDQRCAAVAAWQRVLEADPRFDEVTSEWCCDPQRGWSITTVDGRTRILLGWSDLRRRASRVSQILERSDSVLTKPCVIDARFEGRVIIRSATRLSARLAGLVGGEVQEQNVSFFARRANRSKKLGGGL